MHPPLGSSAARSYPVQIIATLLLVGLTAGACGGGKANPPPGVNPSRGSGGRGATGGANGNGGIMANGGAGQGGQGGESMGTGGASTGGAGGGSAPDVPESETDPVDLGSDPAATPDLAPDVVCTNPCVVGRRRCTATGQVEECKMDGACPVWGDATACPAPTVCMTSGNNAGCQCPTAGPDACRINERRCMGGMLQECKAGAPGTCPAWAAPTTCAANRECTDPAGATADCRCKPVCTAGAKRCAGGALEECAIVDTCLAWKRSECTAPQTCTVVAGVAGCNCPAESCRIGERRCSPTNAEHVQECRGPTGGCGTWQHLKTCPTPQQACSATPTPDCRCKETCTVGDQRCSEGKRQTCRAMTGGCNQFVDDLCTVGACEMTGPRSARCVCPGGTTACVRDEVRCGPGGVRQTCQAGTNGCGTFVNAPCTSPQVCMQTDGSSPDRRATCACPTSETSCKAGDARRCRSGKMEECVDPEADGCFNYRVGSCVAADDHACFQPSGGGPPQCGTACPDACNGEHERECKAGADGTSIARRCEKAPPGAACRFIWKDVTTCTSSERCAKDHEAGGPSGAPPPPLCCPAVACVQGCQTVSGRGLVYRTCTPKPGCAFAVVSDTTCGSAGCSNTERKCL